MYVDEPTEAQAEAILQVACACVRVCLGKEAQMRPSCKCCTCAFSASILAFDVWGKHVFGVIECAPVRVPFSIKASCMTRSLHNPL